MIHKISLHARTAIVTLVLGNRQLPVGPGRPMLGANAGCKSLLESGST